MVYSAQQGSIVPTGIKRKKKRFAPIVQEQAQQGLATKAVAAQKEQEIEDERWAFQQQQSQNEMDIRNQELALSQRQADMAEEQADWGRKKSYFDIGMGIAGTALSIIDTFDLF